MSALAYRPADLATRAGVHVATVHRAVASGDLPKRRIGRATVIPAEAADAWTKARAADAIPQNEAARRG